MKKKILSDVDKRTETITVKVSSAEKVEIKDNASMCGMTPSEFLRHRGRGYEPCTAITPEEGKLLKNLEGLRTDINNFSNAIKAMNRNERIRMFNSVPSMLKWYKNLHPLAVAVNEFVMSVLNGGRITPRTRKSLLNHLKHDSKG